MPQPVASGLMDAYVQAATRRAESSLADSDQEPHRTRLKQWAREIGDCMPFPNRLFADHPEHNIPFETIEVEPHHFELAKLVDALGWMTRLHLTKGGGSASKRPELFASRGLNYQKISFERAAEDRDVFLALTTGVMQSGNCDSNAVFATNLVRSLDADILRALAIDIPLERIRGMQMHDYAHDHVYVAMNFDDEAPRQSVGRIADGDGQIRDANLLPAAGATALWSLDPHQLYPMACRHDHSTYNHLDHTEARSRFTAGSEGHLGVNTQFIEDVRADINRQLNLGEHGIDHALREPVMFDAGIRSKFIDRIMREQNVGHYARVDTGRLSPADREKFQAKVAQIEKEIGRKFLKRLYKAGEFEEHWFGLCLPDNPARLYRHRTTGETLAPRVPPAYFERTEKIRWAYDVWKRTRPERAALNKERTWTRPRFDIHPAIEAIEKLPFLAALAAAKELDFSRNQRHVSQLAAYKIAYASMTDWIGRMHAEMDSTPDLAATLRKAGLRDEVRAALVRAQANLQELDAIMETCLTQLSEAQQNELRAFIAETRRNNPAGQLAELVTRFQPGRHARLQDLVTPQIPARTSGQEVRQTELGRGTA